MQFSAPIYTIGEAAGTAPITVILSTASALTITVNYTTSDGPPPNAATNGADYIAAAGLLTFAPGVTSQTFPVTILNDTLDEPLSETVILTLSAPTNATLGVPNPATLTITDDDAPPTVQFSASTYNVTESDPPSVTLAPITVTLSTASASTVTVDYATSNGTALAGSDYIPIIGTLTFLPLQTSQTFTVTTINDQGEEPPPDETVTLTLSNPANATLSLTNPVTLTITDDDSREGPCVNAKYPPPLIVEIGPPDCGYTYLAGNTITITLPATSVINLTGDPNPTDYELVYYERESDPGSTGFIALDQVTVQISADSVNWYTVFVWEDTIFDANTNIGQASYGGSSGEPDNTLIPMNDPPLYRSSTGPITGIAIDVDNLNPSLNLLPLPPPPGLYPYVRLIGNNQADVDSIEILP